MLTGCQADASINIWVTKAGLKRLHCLNFKRQAHTEPSGSLCKARLHFLDFEAEDRAAGVRVFVPKGEQKSIADHPDTAAGEQDEGDGEFMAALFDEEAAAALSTQQLEEQSQASELTEKPEEEADIDNIPDMFAAIELGVSLAKLAEEKKKLKI